MNVQMLDRYSTHSPDEAPAFAARVCYSDDDPTSTSFEDMISGVAMDKDVYSKDEQHNKLLKQLIRQGHYSVFEHPKATFGIGGVSRMLMAQATRHRHLSFSVQSGRYVDFANVDFYCPPIIKELGLEERYWESVEESQSAYVDLMDGIVGKEYNGREMDEKDARQYARSVLPQSTKVNMVLSGNPRALMHVIDMRNAGDAQGEISRMSGSMLEQLKEWAPKTFGYYEDYAKGSSKKAP